MSKFTTEVRYICQNYAQDNTLSIEDTITKAKPYIFNDTWTAGTEEHKQELEQKILRHYYMQEIGFETVGAWKLYLNSTLAEIMPKYNLLYENLDNIKSKLFDTVDFNEDTEDTSKSHNEGKTETKNTSESDSTGNDNTHSISKSTGKGTGESSNSSDSTAWTEFNDTPQGSLRNIDNGTYLTNATKNRSSGSGQANSSNTSEGTDETTSNNDSTTHTEGNNNSVSNNIGDSNTGRQGTRHVHGKNSGGDYLDQYLKLMNEYNDIDQMIISDLQPLFMGLWE